MMRMRVGRCFVIAIASVTVAIGAPAPTHAVSSYAAGVWTVLGFDSDGITRLQATCKAEQVPIAPNRAQYAFVAEAHAVGAIEIEVTCVVPEAGLENTGQMFGSAAATFQTGLGPLKAFTVCVYATAILLDGRTVSGDWPRNCSLKLDPMQGGGE